MQHSPSNPSAYLRHRLQKPDGVRIGIGVTSPSPELVQMFANAGFDYVVIDMEHGPISIETAYRMVTATIGTGAEAWVRVTHNDPAQFKLALDIGAKHVIVPMITSAREAEQAVSYAKYPPRGVRGWGPFRTQYQWQTDMLDYARRANDETGVIALIEHPGAVRELDAILDVDGLSGAIPAPFDLAVNMGFSDGPNHIEVREAIELIMRKIKARGMRLTSFAVTPEQAVEALRLGVDDLFLGFDPMYIQASVQLFMANVARLRDGEA
ncbi:HpcH/HpaI aldolase family protein [Burkholderia perseverans]|uniref:HpcH/HpaI aldolase family protein n=1 Tax=Burkholderia perseverans TaxID=2615214 RepID=UPI001FEE1EF7|nr:aldolase/citrate lyase family protein [Burkholderia perseverans]